MTVVAVYGRDDQCVQCRQTKRYFKAHHIEYEFHDVDKEPEALAFVQSLGYRAVPVVVTDERHWSGFRPDLLRSLLGLSQVV